MMSVRTVPDTMTRKSYSIGIVHQGKRLCRSAEREGMEPQNAGIDGIWLARDDGFQRSAKRGGG